MGPGNASAMKTKRCRLQGKERAGAGWDLSRSFGIISEKTDAEFGGQQLPSETGEWGERHRAGRLPSHWRQSSELGARPPKRIPYFIIHL